MSPLVSIVVPVYNAAKTLRNTLESLESQNYASLQVIVVDDGSTDNSSAIIGEFNRFQHMTQPNAGQAVALNRGWAESSGKYLGYLSADDLLMPNAVATLVERLELDSGVAVVYPEYTQIAEDGSFIRYINLPDFSETTLIEKLKLEIGPGALFRREIFENTGGWRPNLRVTGDFEFWLRARAYGKFEVCRECLAALRIHPGSQSVAALSPETSDETIWVMKEFCDENREWEREKIVAMATLVAARFHIRSGRFGVGVKRAISAASLRPSIAFSPECWRVLAGGLKGYFKR